MHQGTKMIYNYKCNNEECSKHGKDQPINKPMSESSKVEYCTECGEELKRDYSGGASIKTGDGTKF